ncbi:uncharacterized protein V2V93DRAFT_372394 [Kockiozyma suomiensis]|uniref:uncharacterized protein n=1 Tax=Kockiozyma suomiensis TaxID=1337062 RepID=UPI00334359E0
MLVLRVPVATIYAVRQPAAELRLSLDADASFTSLISDNDQVTTFLSRDEIGVSNTEIVRSTASLALASIVTEKEHARDRLRTVREEDDLSQYSLLSVSLGDSFDFAFDGGEKSSLLAGLTKVKGKAELPPLPQFDPIDLNDNSNYDISDSFTAPILSMRDQENITPRSVSRAQALTLRRRLNTNFAPVREQYQSVYRPLVLAQCMENQSTYRELLADEEGICMQAPEVGSTVLANWHEVVAEMNSLFLSASQEHGELFEDVSSESCSLRFDDAFNLWFTSARNDEGVARLTASSRTNSCTNDTFAGRSHSSKHDAATRICDSDSALKITPASDPVSVTALAPSSTIKTDREPDENRDSSHFSFEFGEVWSRKRYSFVPSWSRKLTGKQKSYGRLSETTANVSNSHLSRSENTPFHAQTSSLLATLGSRTATARSVSRQSSNVSVVGKIRRRLSLLL